MDILSLCLKYKDQGVVGIDVAGIAKDGGDSAEGDELLSPIITKAFQVGPRVQVHD